jgi:hypothetical protein
MKLKDDLFYFEHFINYSERIIIEREIPLLKKNEQNPEYGCESSYETGFDIFKSTPPTEFGIIFKNLYNRLKGIIEAQFSCTVMDETFLQILEWGQGNRLDEHVDARNDDDPVPTPSGNPTRDISSTIYINNNYLGGEINFPNQSQLIKPDAGSLIVFPTTHHYPHAVLPVIDGKRWTMTNFWTIVT